MDIVDVILLDVYPPFAKDGAGVRKRGRHRICFACLAQFSLACSTAFLYPLTGGATSEKKVARHPKICGLEFRKTDGASSEKQMVRDTEKKAPRHPKSRWSDFGETVSPKRGN